MWLVHKQVGLFTHYLTSSGMFKPSLAEARRFSSLEIAEIMAKQHSAAVKRVSETD